MASNLRNLIFTLTATAVMQETRDGINTSALAGPVFTPATALAPGTGADQADLLLFDKTRALTSGTSENLDIFDWTGTDFGPGTGRDIIGNVSTLTEVVLCIIHNDSSSTGTMTVGGEGSAAAWNSLFNGSDTAESGPYPPDGIFVAFNPADPAFAVADISNHLLKIAATGGNITYNIYCFGRSA